MVDDRPAEAGIVAGPRPTLRIATLVAERDTEARDPAAKSRPSVPPASQLD